MSDTIDNCTTLQAMIDAQYGLIETEQAVYSALQLQRQTLGSSGPDLGGIANSGEGGSESYNNATLTQQLSESSQRLRELNQELRELWRMKNERFPWIKTHDHHHHHCTPLWL